MNIHKGVGTMLYEFFNQSIIYYAFIISIQHSTNLFGTEFITKKYKNFSVIELSNQLHPPDLLTARKKNGYPLERMGGLHSWLYRQLNPDQQAHN
jgi:hypothetical protein